MKLESAIIQMLANRIEEAHSAVTKALEENTTARNMCREGKFDVESLLLSSHDHLLIAANTLLAIKDYIPHLALKDETKDETVYHLPPIIR